MRTRIYLLTLLTLAGCGWRTNWGRNRWMEPGPVPEDDKPAWMQRYREDVAACTERGYQTQTYSGGWSAYQGTGGGYGQSYFNQQVFMNCMDVRGWEYQGKSPTVFGQAIF